MPAKHDSFSIRGLTDQLNLPLQQCELCGSSRPDQIRQLVLDVDGQTIYLGVTCATHIFRPVVGYPLTGNYYHSVARLRSDLYERGFTASDFWAALKDAIAKHQSKP